MSTTTHCNKCHKKKKEKDNEWNSVSMWGNIPEEFKKTLHDRIDLCDDCGLPFFKIAYQFFKK